MQVRIFTSRFITMNRSVEQRIRKCQKHRLCMTCLKPIGVNEKSVRGCHAKCARATYRAIERGNYTDEDRVVEGKWLCPGKRGPKPTNVATVEGERT
jgi:hypothetical protein